ncbi:putative DnaJ-related protein rsp1 [Glarea lozoyensis 74030]|uniref:Putative DnaJ-related protein rsp1 n=1 Tax=Glarea lozoyensis (strain ATCC 74030 / MF5533) TaxID=1104152 RepID=H0EEJ1_GLAL7|nr:putative DnaJ-related protein rsp1 [Glarea lozoyensis 74030]
MPAAGEPPTDPAKRKQWYIQTLGDHFVNKKTNEEVFRIGLRPEQDGQRFATSWVGNQPGLEGKMVREKWDQWMNTGKMASGATSLPEVFEKIGKVVSTARLNLFNQNRELAAPQTALFAFAEEVGTIVENLRVEDNEKWRTGAVIGPDSGRGAIADRLKATPEFIAGLTADELKNFAVEVKLSPVASKRGTKPWPIFDPVATKAKWGEKVKDIEAVMTRVSDTYMQDHNLHMKNKNSLSRPCSDNSTRPLAYHPDRNPGRESEVTAKFQKIQSAHEVLTDAAERAKYDSNRSRTASSFRQSTAYSGAGSSGVRGNPWANAGSQWAPPPKKAPTARKGAPPPSAGAQRYQKIK